MESLTDGGEDNSSEISLSQNNVSDEEITETSKRRKHAIRDNVTKDLSKYNLHFKIKEKVLELVKILKLEHRKGRAKKRLYYFYITSAYAELGWVCDPEESRKN